MEKDAEQRVAEDLSVEGKGELSDEHKAEIDSYPEIAIWQLIQSMGHQIYEIERYIEEVQENTPPEAIAHLSQRQAVQAYAATKVVDFGVVFEDKLQGVIGNYWKWYNWWKEYVDNLSDIEFQEIDQAIKNKEDVSEYRPKESWTGLIH